MTLKLFAVYDTVAQIFMPPFAVGTIGEATRGFADLANNPETSINRHPGDYRLMQLGTFDNETGELKADQLNSFGFASDYIANKGRLAGAEPQQLSTAELKAVK